MKTLRPSTTVALGAALVVVAALSASAPANSSSGGEGRATPAPSPFIWNPFEYKIVAVSSAAPPQAVICDPTTANQCATVNTSNQLVVAVKNDPLSKIVDSGGANVATVDAAGELAVTGGGETVWPPVGTTPANAVNTCTVLSGTAPKRVSTLVVESGTQQAAGTDLVLYDTTSTSGCTTANEIYHTGQIGAGGSYPVNWPISSGVAYKFIAPVGTVWAGDGFRISGN